MRKKKLEKKKEKVKREVKRGGDRRKPSSIFLIFSAKIKIIIKEEK
jgi:hypothetical protein